MTISKKVIQYLPETFIGLGEVRGFKFERVKNLIDHYVYRVITPEGTKHFEVISKVLNPICIDFEKREYSVTDFKETYPKSKDFGKVAWTCLSSAHLSDKLKKLGYDK